MFGNGDALAALCAASLKRPAPNRLRVVIVAIEPETCAHLDDCYSTDDKLATDAVRSSSHVNGCINLSVDTPRVSAI